MGRTQGEGRKNSTHRALVGVRVELALDIAKQTLVQLLFLLGEVVAADVDDARRESQVVGALDLCATQHEAAQEHVELVERLLTGA